MNTESALALSIAEKKLQAAIVELSRLQNSDLSEHQSERVRLAMNNVCDAKQHLTIACQAKSG